MTIMGTTPYAIVMPGLYLIKVWLILSLVLYVDGARILAILPLAFRSHHLFFQATLKALTQKGHHVVVYSPFPQEVPVPNYTDVFVNTSFSDKYITYEKVLESFADSPITVNSKLWKTLSYFTEQTLQHENIQILAKSDQTFDLVLTETFMANEALLAFGHKFKAPTIALYSMGSFGVINRLMGNSLSLSFIPNYVFKFSNKMTLNEKLVSSFSTMKNLFSYYQEHIPHQQEMMNRHLKFLDSPPLSEMIENISMVFLNSHPVASYPQPLTPNIVQLGGIHISVEKKDLTQELQQFMDEADHGVIFFSLGTFVPDHQMPSDYFEKFIKAFAKLKQRVLWRTRAEYIAGLPDNVKTTNWAPQQNILAHPKCVLFLTHGGLLSMLEVIHAGVPVVGVPFFSDQPLNIQFLKEKGVGVELDFLTLSEDSIFTALSTVLNNPKYKANAVKLSKIFCDLPMNQAESAVYWVEYVLRHQGAQHLRPASAHMPWYQLALLDVLALIVLVTISTIVTIYWLCQRISQWFSKIKRQTDPRKKKE